MWFGHAKLVRTFRISPPFGHQRAHLTDRFTWIACILGVLSAFLVLKCAIQWPLCHIALAESLTRRFSTCFDRRHRRKQCLNSRQQQPLIPRQPRPFRRRHPERRPRFHRTCHEIILVAGFLCIQWCEKLPLFPSSIFCERVCFFWFYFYISRFTSQWSTPFFLFFSFTSFIFPPGPPLRLHICLQSAVLESCSSLQKGAKLRHNDLRRSPPPLVLHEPRW